MTPYRILAEALEIEEADARARLRPDLDALKVKAHALEGQLLKLMLSNSSATWNGHRYTVFTTFLNMLSFKWPGRNESAKTNERAELLARTIFGQWLLQQLYGARVYRDGSNKQRSALVGSLASAVQKLEQAFSSGDPSALFGFRAASRYASIFKLPWHFHSTKLIEQELNDLIDEAVAEIHEALQIREVVQVNGTYPKRARSLSVYWWCCLHEAQTTNITLP